MYFVEANFLLQIFLLVLKVWLASSATCYFLNLRTSPFFSNFDGSLSKNDFLLRCLSFIERLLPSRHRSSNDRPLISMLAMNFKHEILFYFGPTSFLYIWIQMVMPSFLNYFYLYRHCFPVRLGDPNFLMSSLDIYAQFLCP